MTHIAGLPFVSDTYRVEISDRYPIRDRIYYGRHRILGWHTYPGMEHLPGNFNSPNEIAFTHTTHNIPGIQHTQLITRGIPGRTAQLITCGIPGRTAHS